MLAPCCCQALAKLSCPWPQVQKQWRANRTTSDKEPDPAKRTLALLQDWQEAAGHAAELNTPLSASARASQLAWDRQFSNIRQLEYGK